MKNKTIMPKAISRILESKLSKKKQISLNEAIQFQKKVIQRNVTPQEITNITEWLQNNAKNYLSTFAPSLIVDAPLSTCIRLRWFSVNIGGNNYNIGINIHYGGISGGMWFKNISTNQTYETHPFLHPQHGLKEFIEGMMPIHIMGWDQNNGTNFHNILSNGH